MFPTKLPNLRLPGYMDRWYLIPRSRRFNVYLHRIYGSDKPIPHDHPWWSVSFCLWGWMREHIGIHAERSRIVPWLWPVFRSSTHSHWMEILRGPVWTLFITGPTFRHWGFWLRGKWIPHADFDRFEGES